MKKKLLFAASLAAAVSVPALADSHSSARIFAVQVQISDANPADGSQPSFGLLDFPVVPANSANAMVERGSQRQDSAATTMAGAGANNLLAFDGNVLASAVYSGWSFNNQTMSAGGEVQGNGVDGLSYAYASSASWNSAPSFDGRLPFWIGPGTTFLLRIATTVSAETSVGAKVGSGGSSFSEGALRVR